MTQSARDILTYLEKVKNMRGYWIASCPAHKDDNPSLSVKETSDGKVLFKCHKGCSQEEVIAALKNMGAWADQPKHEDNVLSEFRYKYADGTTAYSIRRMPDENGKKKFMAVQPDGTYGLGKADKLPYKLPEVSKAKTVIIVEGEKDVHTVEGLGLVGTTFPFGAGAWRDEYAIHFKNKRVVVLPDNDEAGMNHALDICKGIYELVEAVKIVKLPGLKEKGDISDWVIGKEKEEAKQELFKLFKNTPVWKPKSDTGLIRVSDVKPEEVHFLWYPYIPIGKVTLIDGDPGVGKSYLTQAIGTAITLGYGIPDWTSTPSNVLYLSTEDEVSDTIRPRMEAMGAILDQVYVDENYFVLNDAGFERLSKLIKESHASIVFIDPLVAYFGAKMDMNKANETRSVMARLAQIGKTHHCAVVGIRHLRKDATKKGAGKKIYRGTGSIDIVGASRSVLMVEEDQDASSYKKIMHIKCNVAPRGTELTYQLRGSEFYWIGEQGQTRLEDTKEEQLEGWEKDAVSECEKLSDEQLEEAFDIESDEIEVEK